MGLFNRNADRPFEVRVNGRRIDRAATEEQAILIGDATRKSYVVMRDGRQVFVHTKVR